MSYFAKSTIKHNGVTFKAGEEVTGLSEKEGKDLFDAGVVQTETGEEAPSHVNTGDNVAMNPEAEAADAAETPGGENEDGGSSDDSGEGSGLDGEGDTDPSENL